MKTGAEISTTSIFGVYIAIVIAVYMILLFPGDMPAPFLSALTSLSVVAVPLVYSIAKRRPVFGRRSREFVKSDIGFTAGVCVLLFAGMFASTLGLSLLLAPVHRLMPGLAPGGMPRDSDPVVKFALTALLPAICEEVSFRGFFYFSLRKTVSERRALMLSSLLFAILHPIPASLPGVFIAGLALGAAAGLSGTVIPSILMHVFHNGLLLAIVPVWRAMHPGRLEMLILLGVGFTCYGIAWLAVKKRALKTEHPS